jgi:hypothetical protein
MKEEKEKTYGEGITDGFKLAVVLCTLTAVISILLSN